MILAGPGYLGHGAALLWAATPHGGSAPFYDIQVTPGDVSVRRNSDQMVTAQLIGLQTQNVRLYARYQSASKWDQVPMRPQAGGSGFQFVFAGLPESVEYYVEAGPLDSKHFNIRVLDLPDVKNVRVTYRYPSWTHLQNVTEERGGDLRAVEGTEADLEVETDQPHARRRAGARRRSADSRFRAAKATSTRARFTWRRTACTTSPRSIRASPCASRTISSSRRARRSRRT